MRQDYCSNEKWESSYKWYTSTDLSDVSPCNHEEVDTRILLHTLHQIKSKSRKVCISTVNTDVIVIVLSKFYELSTVGLEELWVEFQRWIQGARLLPPFFLRSLVLFCFFFFFPNHFEELQTMLFEAELIINNKPLTYLYANTIETPNHLLFGRQWLYSSNTTSAVIRNLTVLSSTTDKINRTSNNFLDRWRHGYVINLCETTNIKIKYKLPKFYKVRSLVVSDLH